MRDIDTLEIHTYATDSGLICPHCDGTSWLYRLYLNRMVKTGDAATWKEQRPEERYHAAAGASTFTARCAGCHCCESWDSRGVAVPETIGEVKEEHEFRRKLATEGRPYALARTFVVRTPLPRANLLILAFSPSQAMDIATWQIIGGPVKYVHADDPLDWTVPGVGKPVHAVPCMECGQDVAAADCAPGWGFVQLHEECKHVARRKTMADMTRRIEAGF